jgi:hypothetical protein
MTTNLFIIPLKTMNESIISAITTKNKLKPIPKAYKSFVDALNNFCDIPSNQLLVPTMKGA